MQVLTHRHRRPEDTHIPLQFVGLLVPENLARQNRAVLAKELADLQLLVRGWQVPDPQVGSQRCNSDGREILTLL